MILLLAGGIVFLLLLCLWTTYNHFVRARNKVKTDFADIDVQLKRRASLIENLVEIVKGYAKHEKETFENVAKARTMLESSHSPKDSGEADNILSKTLKSIFAVSEAYPKLRASENFQRLQSDLKETEDLIAEHREIYNRTVLDYNTTIQVFPNLLIAGIFGFGEEELFQPGIGGREEVEVSI